MCGRVSPMSVSGNNGSCLADKTFFCCYGKFFNQFPVSHMYIRPISAFAKTAKICILAFCNSSQHAKVKDHQGRCTNQCNFLKTERLSAQKVDKSRENIFPPLVVAEEDTAGRTNAGRPPRAAIIQLFIGRMGALALWGNIFGYFPPLAIIFLYKQ